MIPGSLQSAARGSMGHGAQNGEGCRCSVKPELDDVWWRIQKRVRWLVVATAYKRICTDLPRRRYPPPSLRRIRSTYTCSLHLFAHAEYMYASVNTPQVKAAAAHLLRISHRYSQEAKTFCFLPARTPLFLSKYNT